MPVFEATVGSEGGSGGPLPDVVAGMESAGRSMMNRAEATRVSEILATEIAATDEWNGETVERAGQASSVTHGSSTFRAPSTPKAKARYGASPPAPTPAKYKCGPHSWICTCLLCLGQACTGVWIVLKSSGGDALSGLSRVPLTGEGECQLGLISSAPRLPDKGAEQALRHKNLNLLCYAVAWMTRCLSTHASSLSTLLHISLTARYSITSSLSMRWVASAVQCIGASSTWMLHCADRWQHWNTRRDQSPETQSTSTFTHARGFSSQGNGSRPRLDQDPALLRPHRKRSRRGPNSLDSGNLIILGKHSRVLLMALLLLKQAQAAITTVEARVGLHEHRGSPGGATDFSSIANVWAKHGASRNLAQGVTNPTTNIRKRAFHRAVRRASQNPNGETWYRGRLLKLGEHGHSMLTSTSSSAAHKQ